MTVDRRLPRIATIAISAALLLPAVASADAVQQDVDFTAPGKDDQTLRLGPVEPGATIDRTAKFRLVCNRLYRGKVYKKHVDEGQVLSIEYIRTKLDGTGTPADASATHVTFPPVPAWWPDDGRGCTLNPPRLAQKASAISFKAPAAPGKHTVDVRYKDVLAPVGNKDAGAITGTPPMTVHFKFNVVSDKKRIVARFNNAMAKGLVQVQEVDGDTARVAAGWKKRPFGTYKIVGSTAACTTDFTAGNRVFTDAGKTRNGKWNFTVPTTANVDTIKSIRIRRGTKESCAPVVVRQAAGMPFSGGSPRSLSKVGKPGAKGLAQVTKLPGVNKFRVDMAWKTRPAGAHKLVGSTRPCSVKDIGAAKVFAKSGLTKSAAWIFKTPALKKQEKLQSIRVRADGKQKACLVTTQLKNS